MAGRIVLFGATGYTGRLAAESMVERGLKPVLAGRTQAKLDSLAAELGGGLETQTADVADPPSVRSSSSAGDVLVTTVGPFARWGSPPRRPPRRTARTTSTRPASRSSSARCSSATGRRRSSRASGCSPRSDTTGCPGTSPARWRWTARASWPRASTSATSSAEAGPARAAARWPRSSARCTAPAFGFRDGRVQTERGAKRVRSFRVGSKELAGVSVGSSEHFALPRLAPRSAR